MKKIALIAVALMGLVSCSKNEISLSRLDVTVQAEVTDHSPIYLTKKQDSDSVAVNRANALGGTNWVFSVQRNLNAKLVLEEVQKLKDKKYADKAHGDDKAVFFSYADTLNKNLAFYPFQYIDYQFKRPESQRGVLYFNGSNDLFLEDQQVQWSELETRTDSIKLIHLCFSATLSFEEYLQNRIRLEQSDVLNQKLDSIDRIY
ncbi:hypothetical protein [Flavobacterium sp. JP2137]|uniref:hypothetical protein n=1 Tax=Flavobacterium sp. JP2137 TaxID=3414510 RepID=UPI003D3016B3